MSCYHPLEEEEEDLGGILLTQEEEEEEEEEEEDKQTSAAAGGGAGLVGSCALPEMFLKILFRWWWVLLKVSASAEISAGIKATPRNGFLGLFYAASMPVVKVLLLTALGSFLALNKINILGETARKHLNRIVFFVFNPALFGSNLAKTITSEDIVKLWFMPVNVLLTYILGSALGWILVLITRPPPHLKGLILGSCAAGNLGSLLIIIIPAVCREKDSPFGNPDVCHEYGMAYASLSMALGTVFVWSYVYNIVRVFSSKTEGIIHTDDSIIDIKSFKVMAEKPEDTSTEKVSVLHSCSSMIFEKIKQQFGKLSRQVNISAVFAPSTIGALIGFTIGTVAPVRKLMIDGNNPLHVIQNSAYLLGGAAIPTLTLIVGGNLVRGLKGSGVQLSIILGIIVVRYAFLPVLGIIIVKGAIRFGLVHSDPLYQFVLLLQFALPPSINIGTMTQLFGSGESECSLIMLWTYSLASVSLTLWSAFFMWLVS